MDSTNNDPRDAGVLSSCAMIAGLDRDTLAEMAQALVSETWPKNCQLLAPDTPAERFRILVRGRVKITRSNGDNGRELTLWLLGPGEGFDIVSLLDAEPHAVSAWTLDEVQALSGPVSLFRDWIERLPPFRLAIHGCVARQLRELADLASDIALHDTTTRMARLLLRHFDEASAGLNLVHDLPQEELANLIGSVRVVVSRVLATLKREGVLELHNGAVRVKDLKRLLRRAELRIQRAARPTRRDRQAKV